MEAEQHGGDETTKAFFDHSAGQRINTDALIAKTLAQQYPSLELVVIPAVDLLGFASAGHASFTLTDDAGKLPSNLIWKYYIPPSRRIDGNPGFVVQDVVFAKFFYKWESLEVIVYIVDGRDGSGPYPQVRNSYILTSDTAKVDALLVAAGKWSNDLHDEVWVFDGGSWSKSAELYQSVMKSTWDSVIMDDTLKKAIVDDHLSFFGSRDTYERLKVPWKRGVIYYGPPGNGKTISIKAMMHTLYNLKDPIPTLYVRNFISWGGPEYAIRMIFELARRTAPCYLVLEDLDSLVTDQVRSYFLNEIDGLKSNDGIFIIGSTNHLDRLDPGISKRPSRFDRKYFFAEPDHDQRVAYCKFWQKKLADNKDIDFPDKLCDAIAGITDGFSFAYIQEAFVAALLVIARGNASDLGGDEDGWVVADARDDDDDDDDDDELEKLVLWIEIQKQVAILREGIDNSDS